MNYEKDIAAATEELLSLSTEEIEEKTARAWAFRAIAARRLGWTIEAEGFEHEAIEHAAFGRQGFLDSVRALLAEF